MLIKNWDELVRKLPTSLRLLGNVVDRCVRGFTSEEKIEEVKAFFKEHGTTGFEQILAQALDDVKAKSKWVKRDEVDTAEWLRKEGYFP